MTSMTQDFKRLKKNFGFFRIIGYFEILSHYPNIDSSHSLKEDGNSLTDKYFIDKFMV